MAVTLQSFAPAKINLFLHVTGRREDGYHTLQSLMAFVDVGDELELSAHDSLFVDTRGPFAEGLENPRENLVYRAALLLAEQFRVQPRARITLTKNLPLSSGIGGGSSDAAAALRGLAKLWALPDDADRLRQIAEKLGADVPACFYRKLVWAEGTGEKMTRVPDTPLLYFVLVNPLIATPTPEVFRHFRGRFSAPIQFSGRRKSDAQWIADLRIYRNDLTEAAIAVTPEIREVLQALAATGECLLHRLSGSGATCFGLYASADAAKAAAAAVQNAYPGWWVKPAGMLK